ncbi:MAG TPA: hypothetical protein VGM46_01915 [Mesorhizobium sp.]|jgi:hypothetical protein
MAIRFSSKEQPAVPASKGGKPAPEAETKKPAAEPDASDLFDPDDGQPSAKAKGRKKK